MERITISRDDDLYEAFADIAQTPDGMLAVTYRESLRHGPQPFSRVVVRTKERTNGDWTSRPLPTLDSRRRTALPTPADRRSGGGEDEG